MDKLCLQFLTPLKYLVSPIVGSGRLFSRAGVLSFVSHPLHSVGFLTHQFLYWRQMQSSFSLFFPQPCQLFSPILSFTPGMSFLNCTVNLLLLKYSPRDCCHYRANALPCVRSLWNLFITWPLSLPQYYLLPRCLIYWKCPGSALLNICSTSCTCTYWSQNTIFSPWKWSRDEWNMQTPGNKSTDFTVRVEMPMVLRWCL